MCSSLRVCGVGVAAVVIVLLVVLLFMLLAVLVAMLAAVLAVQGLSLDLLLSSQGAKQCISEQPEAD